MRRTDWKPLFDRTVGHATAFLEGLPERPVSARSDAAALLTALDKPLPQAGASPADVVDELVRIVDPGLTAMPSGRFFGWVIGGGLPSAVAADWLTSVWDQNTGSGEGTPAAAAIEDVVLRWIAQLLEVPATSGALVTGAQMASFVGLAVARAEVLRASGWNLEEQGMQGAPPIEVVVGAERHGTIDKALRMLGFGTKQVRIVDADRDGRIRADRFTLDGSGPLIVCAQAGNVNGGAFDPLRPIGERVADAKQRRPVWLHLDGAFGLWARVSPARRALVDGAELADSWSTDAHKWLNTPYDCGIALVRDAEAHRRTFHGGATYLPGMGAVPNPFDHTPELSRRARGFALWAALRELGRSGITDLVERCCTHATAFAKALSAVDGIEVMNEVALNQLVVRFGNDDDHTRAVTARVIAEGVCYPSVTTWRGVAGMRISVSNWSTDEDDVRRSTEAIVRAHAQR
ncbi:MAG: pyridoxal-dependent decarboxylase [Myxococcota bacterium]|nr:pyridoxal-dependent decarboxylase [Myxococcota bacterium]